MIRHFGQSLTPPERSTHRAWIGVRVEALLDGYWHNRPSEVVKQEILRDWMDLLDGFTRDEVTDACRAWLRDKPRLKPTPGDIAQLVTEARGRALARWRASRPPEPEPERQPISKERAAELMAQAGFTPRRMGRE
jgi:hypothetical protein